MDLYKAIRQLYEERARLDRVIASLEELQRAAEADSEEATAKRRGRKAMSEEERRQVSERMKQYWADRRKKPKRGPTA